MTKIMASYGRRQDPNGDLWIDVAVNGLAYDSIGPFETESELNAALGDLQDMMRHTGAVDMPRLLS